MENGTGDVLNLYQERHLQVAVHEADRLLSDIEQVLNSAGSKSPFPKYVVDLTPAQRKTIEDYIGRIRARLVRVLEGQNIEPESPSIPATRAIHSALTFIDIAVEELKPRYMRGYGEVPPAAAPQRSETTNQSVSLNMPCYESPPYGCPPPEAEPICACTSSSGTSV